MYKPDVRTLEILRAVTRAGSATAASRALGISQPAVTKAVALIERRTGIQLFVRDRQGMRPTREGSLVHVAIEQGLSGLDRIAASFEAIRAGAEGRLRIVALPVLGEASLARQVGRYAALTPALRIELGVDSPQRIVERVGLGEADVGVLFGPLAVPEELSATRLGERALVAFMLPEHALAARPTLTFADLAPHPLVAISPPHAIRSAMEAGFFRAGAAPRVLCDSATQRGAAGIAAGAGAVALMDSEIAGDLPEPCAVRPVEPRHAWPILGVHATAGAPRAASRFLAWLAARERESAGPPAAPAEQPRPRQRGA